MTITIRQRKNKYKARLYFDYYHKGKRKTESLELYLILPAKGKKLTKEEQAENSKIMKLAERIKTIREQEFIAKQYDIDDLSKLNASFIQYFENLADAKASRGNQGNWKSCLILLKAYTRGQDITFSQLNKTWIQGFKNYLEFEAVGKHGKKLSQNTKLSYFNKLKAALKQARYDEIIKNNPGELVKGFQEEESDRTFLLFEELEALVATDCKNELLKRAFIFSCLSGLRWSDVTSLRWRQIEYTEKNGYSIRLKQRKTNKDLYHFISEDAKVFLGPEGNSDERIFAGLTYSAHNNHKLQEWVYKAGIKKEVTFHCARHTYATLQLTEDTDLYTVSKLLGHKYMKTTERYGKIIDQKRIEAAKKLRLTNGTKI